MWRLPGRGRNVRVDASARTVDRARQVTDQNAGPQAQIVAVGLDGNVWHNVIHADGSLQGWGAPAGTGTTSAMAAQAVAIAGSPAGESRILAIGTDGTARHTVRRADGTWDLFRPVPVGPGGRSAFAAGTISVAAYPDGTTQTLIGAR
ncbi:hypothetical protein ACIGD1_18960 [Streptomyces sp. NPDC085612]|uniref:hypothetical protein n=1 Tax=Streptomyces sp. NPDC085612 TaxID=3365732 RepID=UPI0037CFF140